MESFSYKTFFKVKLYSGSENSTESVLGPGYVSISLNFHQNISNISIAMLNIYYENRRRISLIYSVSLVGHNIKLHMETDGRKVDRITMFEEVIKHTQNC